LVLVQGTEITLFIYLVGLLYRHSIPQPSLWSLLAMLAAPVPFAVFLAMSDLYETRLKYVWVGLLQGMAMWLTAMARARIVWRDSVVVLARVRAFDLLLYLTTSGLLFLSVGLFRKYLRHMKFAATKPEGEQANQREVFWKYVFPAVLAFIASIASLLVQMHLGPQKAGK
jgi:hypothetical protein